MFINCVIEFDYIYLFIWWLKKKKNYEIEN